MTKELIDYLNEHKLMPAGLPYFDDIEKVWRFPVRSIPEEDVIPLICELVINREEYYDHSGPNKEP